VYTPDERNPRVQSEEKLRVLNLWMLVTILRGKKVALPALAAATSTAK